MQCKPRSNSNPNGISARYKRLRKCDLLRRLQSCLVVLRKFHTLYKRNISVRLVVCGYKVHQIRQIVLRYHSKYFILTACKRSNHFSIPVSTFSRRKTKIAQFTHYKTEVHFCTRSYHHGTALAFPQGGIRLRSLAPVSVRQIPRSVGSAVVGHCLHLLTRIPRG